ncbi:hypothetical protein A3I40_02335 [Candidatus Uhrbacteria bacterium RIFCSPLOWO2_02_FULL_48_12]|uniref:Uncharacterized protein n=1 Tax=Candidatus Uhrbacteria bacterium RIFCSPLOWO2_02_FULL_48_12 TaxID=1802407 RepID=A0A1F7VAL6_9BACT|nr:MAG: hypothetical protein A3I40_02335 [Candidatus Uhrbacteria bacterium RIFCSPLOWO2_02_FULL_48_12]
MIVNERRNGRLPFFEAPARGEAKRRRLWLAKFMNPAPRLYPVRNDISNGAAPDFFAPRSINTFLPVFISHCGRASSRCGANASLIEIF